ncbi:MAG: hypothetical protein V7603_5150 [Micromonosporaceae bacterium]
MTDPNAPIPALGQQLLQRARAHGMTGEELGILLGLSVAQIRVIASLETFDHYPARVLRKLAERLDLPWPDWLTTTPAWPDPPHRDTRQDSAQVHAVLAAAFGQPMHLSEIADILGWTTARVRAAADQLATPEVRYSLGLARDLPEHPDREPNR